MIALLAIGDGVAGFTHPRWHSLLWNVGPAPYRRLVRQLAGHPGEARWFYAAEVVLGTWVATALVGPSAAGDARVARVRTPRGWL